MTCWELIFWGTGLFWFAGLFVVLLMALHDLWISSLEGRP